MRYRRIYRQVTVGKSSDYAVLLGFIGLPWIVVWWRRRESNPRPQALRRRLYMLSLVFGFDRLLPDRQGRQTASPVKVLTHPPRTGFRASLWESTPGSGCTSTGPGQRLAG